MVQLNVREAHSGSDIISEIKVDFHCRVIFTCVRT